MFPSPHGAWSPVRRWYFIPWNDAQDEEDEGEVVVMGGTRRIVGGGWSRSNHLVHRSRQDGSVRGVRDTISSNSTSRRF